MEPNQQGKRKRNLTFWATIGLFLLTFGKNAFMILKSAKFLTPFLTMLVSIGAYALIAPLEFAIGFVILILIHELGHVWAAKIKGLPVTAPVFIPFLGALIMMKRHPRDAQTEAFIAFGGPLIGSLGALVFLWVGLAFGNALLIQLAYVGLFLNLINLLPIQPLDGGRISVAVSRWLWLFGLIGSRTGRKPKPIGLISMYLLYQTVYVAVGSFNGIVVPNAVVSTGKQIRNIIGFEIVL
jgi:Zn-dependent protease